MCDWLSNLYHATVWPRTLQKELFIAAHSFTIVFTRVPCHVSWGVRGILFGQTPRVSRLSISLPQEDAIVTRKFPYLKRALNSRWTAFHLLEFCIFQYCGDVGEEDVPWPKVSFLIAIQQYNTINFIVLFATKQKSCFLAPSTKALNFFGLAITKVIVWWLPNTECLVIRHHRTLRNC